MSARPRLARIRRLARDRRGVSAVEFAMIAPIFCLIFAAAADLGGALMTKYKLDAAVAAGVNFAQVNGPTLSSSTAPALASNIAALIQSSQAAAWANTSIVVNNGPTATVAAGVTTTGGTASNADQCYCPSGGAGSTSWGAAQTCGSVCTGPNTGYAGKFVTISATKTYTPLLSTYGLVQNPITATATAQVQ